MPARGGFVEVDVEDRLGPEPGRLRVPQRVEQLGGERHGPRHVCLDGLLLLGRLGLGLGRFGVFEEELEQLGGPGQPPERQRPQQVTRCLGVLGTPGEDVCDPGDHGVDVDGVAGGDAGDHVSQPDRVRPRQGHEPAVPGFLEPCGVGGGVGLDDLGLDQGDHPGRGLGADRP